MGGAAPMLRGMKPPSTAPSAYSDEQLAAADRYRAAAGNLDEVLELVTVACHVPVAAFEILGRDGAHLTLSRGVPPIPVGPSRGNLPDLVVPAASTVVVADARRDPRVGTHPLVAAQPTVRFLAA